ncbi:MAG: hypothetical protein ACRD3J_17605, partial [Thermoanaerobaculia bacterium]
ELPAWSASGSEIVYGFDGHLMVVRYSVEGTRFSVQTPQPWPGGRYQTRGRTRMFDLHPDGDRVVLAPAAMPPSVGSTHTAQFVFNFFDELRRLAPVTR